MEQPYQQDYQHSDAIDIEGIEVFGSPSPIGKLPTSYPKGIASLQAALTIKQAAKFFGVSTNTVRSRIKAGELQACKVKGATGEEWRVFPEGLQEDSQEPTKTLPASSGESDINRFLDIIQKQADKLESASGQIGYLKSQLESYERELATSQETIKLLTDNQAKNRSWWHSFASWFLGVR